MTRTVLLSMDAFRADRLSADHLPECWEAFDEEFCIFGNAYSHGTATPLAFPGLITGRTASGDGTLEADATTLAEMHDGPSLARVNNPHLSVERGYGRGIDEFYDPDDGDDPVERLKERLGRSEMVRRVYHGTRRVLPDNIVTADLPYTPAERLSDWAVNALDEDPDFLWAHYMDPHTPHTRDTITDRDVETKYGGDYQALTDRFHDGVASDEELRVLRDLYDEHVRYLDRHLSRVLDAMRAREWWDDALVVVVGDHGEAFGEEGQMAHPWDDDPIPEVARTPLAVKFPDGAAAGERREHLVAHRDVHAEVATRIGADVTGTGRPLRDDADRVVVTKSNSALRVTADDGWLVRRRDGSEDTGGKVTDAMREAADTASFPRVPLLSGDVVGTNAGENVEDRLEALGYR